MKLHNMDEVTGFLETVNKCTGQVYLETGFGDRFNLKSPLSQYVAVGELLKEHGDSLELFCENRADEGNFFKFFQEHSSVVA